MKFESGQKVFYVCPYVFTIEKVTLDYFDEHSEHWVEETQGMLPLKDLFDNLNDAKQHAHNLLDKFYNKQREMIDNYEDEK